LANLLRQQGLDTTTPVIYTNDGRFMYLLSRADLPKFASNNRASGTSDENKAVVQGSISLFGTYSLAGNDLLIKIEHSTFPNWSGTDQKRTITLTGDEMKWTNPAGSAGGGRYPGIQASTSKDHKLERSVSLESCSSFTLDLSPDNNTRSRPNRPHPASAGWAFAPRPRRSPKGAPSRNGN